MHKLVREFFSSLSILLTAAKRLYQGDGFSSAGALAYTSLLSLVPLVTLSIALLPGFGVGGEEAQEVIEDIINKLLPPSAITTEELLGDTPSPETSTEEGMGDVYSVAEAPDEGKMSEAEKKDLIRELKKQISGIFGDLSKNVAKLNALSIAFLVGTSIALLLTIQGALNSIWRVNSDSSITTRLLNFWAIITLGLLLFALSIFFTTRLQLLDSTHPIKASPAIKFFSHFLPTVLSWLALTVLYFKGPSTKVRLRDAALGALVAAVMFEFLKVGFAYYVGLSTNYDTLYGTLASIPLFLFWLYLIWLVVIFGAQTSYLLGNTAILRSLGKFSTELGEAGFFLGAKLLYLISKRFVAGELPPTESSLTSETGADPVSIRNCLDALTRANFLSDVDEKLKARTLLIPPEKINLSFVYEAFLQNPLKLEKEQRMPRGFVNVLKTSGKKFPDRELKDLSIMDLLACETTE